MFGISWAEFLVIFLVAVVVLPARMWPDVARFLARAVNMVRAVVWRVTDASEQIKNRLDLEQPIDEVIRATTDDILGDFSSPRPTGNKSPRRAKRRTAKK